MEKQTRQVFIPVTSCVTYLIDVDTYPQGRRRVGLAVLFNDTAREESGYSCNMFGRFLDFSNIPAKHLKNFVFIDDGSFGVSYPFDSQSSIKNTKETEEVLGKPLYNWRNRFFPLKICTFENSLKEPKDLRVPTAGKLPTASDILHEFVVMHGSSAPCARVGHCFVISPEEQCGYLFGGFIELQAQDSRGLPQGKPIFYPLDDCWRLHLRSLKWEKIFDSPVPRVITSETRIPDYFLRCEAFYDQKTKLIIGYGERMEFKISGESNAQDVAVGTAFIIDPVLKVRKVVGTLNTNFIRILPDLYVVRDSVFFRLLYTPKKSPIRSFDVWSSDINRLLREELVRDVLEDKNLTWINSIWRSGLSTLLTDQFPEVQTIDGPSKNGESAFTVAWIYMTSCKWCGQFSSGIKQT